MPDRIDVEKLRASAALDAAIARGLADAEAGRVKFAEEVFDRPEAKYRAMSRLRGDPVP
jgi:antitoxin ParD1/3/4